MNILSVEIQNFGVHKNTKIEFPDKITAITAPNGSGKSYILEATPACLFGTWPSQGNLIDGVTNGYTGDCYLGIHFIFDSVYYIAERKIRKTAKGHTSEAMLYKVIDEKSIAVAGPKVLDFDNAIKNLLGDSKVFFASVFSASDSKGDIVDCKPTERKKILAELLGLNIYQEKSDMYGVKAREIDSKLSNFETEKENLLSLAKEVDENELIDSRAKLSAYEKQQEKLNEVVAGIEKSKAEITIKYNEIAANKKKKEEILDQTDANDKEISTIEGKIISCKKLDVDELQEHQKQRNEDLKNQDVVNSRNVEKKNKELQNAEIDKKATALFNEVTKLEREIENDIDGHRQKIEALESRSSLLLEGLYDGEQCRRCRFVADAIKASEELAATKKEPDTKDKENKVAGLKKQIQEYNGQKIAVGRQEDLPGIREDRSKFLNDALVSEEKIKGYQKEIDRLKKLNDNLYAQSKAIVLDMDLEEKLKSDASALRIEESGIEEKRKEVSDFIKYYLNKISEIDSIVTRNKEIQQKIVTLEIQNKQNIHDFKVYEYLKKAFGRNGIQALLIDSSIPKLQAISDRLTKKSTGDKMSLRFSTVKHNKDGRTAESLEILATDQEGFERDVSTFSKGEQKLLRASLRITISSYQAQTSPKKLDTLFLDEVLDGLDPENSELMLEVLMSLDEYVEKVIFISHSDQLLTDIPNKVYLEKRNGVTYAKD